jgi:hypothetical protein
VVLGEKGDRARRDEIGKQGGTAKLRLADFIYET